MTPDTATARWLVIVVAAVGVYALRSSFIVLWDRVEELPEEVTLALSLVPPAVLATFILPGVLSLGGDLTLNVKNSRLVAAPAAIIVAYRTESIFWTLVVGIGVLLLWQSAVA